MFCSLGGDKEECASLRDRQFDHTTPPVLMNWIAFSLEMFVCLINLNFIITFTDVKNVTVWLSHRFRRTK